MPILILAPLVLPLLFAPVSTDRGAAAVEVEAPAVDAPSATLESAPEPAVPPTPAPAAMPMPVPVAPPPSAHTQQSQPPVAEPPPEPSRRRRDWPERPIRWRVDIAGQVGTAVMGDLAWRAFDRDRSVFQLGATVRGDFRLGDGRIFLGGGLTYRRFDSGGAVHGGALYSGIRVREPIGFLRLAVVTLDGLDVFVQAGGGPSVYDLDLHSSHSAFQGGVLGMIDANAGLALYLPKKWLPRRGSSRVTGGLELAAGYTFRSKIRVRPDFNTGDDPIASSAADFGDLAVRGFAWRFGLFIRFQ